MARHVLGTRERRYRVETPHDVTAWVADEIDSMASGWVPLTSEREPDGCLRVLYGLLPPELSGPADAEYGGSGNARVATAPILHPPMGAGWGLALVLALVTFLASFAMFVRP